MKKIIIILLVCLTAVSMNAQSKFTRSFEVAAGCGFSGGPIPTLYPEYVFNYDLGHGMTLGAGLALQFARALEADRTNNKGNSKEYVPELSLPLFLRFGYTENNLFTRLDAGYALIGFLFDEHGVPYPYGSYRGFFFEPQVGYKLSEKRALALGILMHQNSITMSQVFTETSTDSGSPVIHTYSRTIRGLVPAITLRYIRTFEKRKK